MADRKISVIYEFLDPEPATPRDSKEFAKIDKEVMDIAKAMQNTGLRKIELLVFGGDKGSEVKKS